MKSYRSFGLFGVIVLMFGLLAGVITSTWTSRYVLVHLILGTALLGLYLFTHVENLKESVTGRRAQYGTNTVVYTLMTLGVLGMVNYLGVQHSFRYDATEQGMFSVAPQTRQVLEGLDEEVAVYAFFREAEGIGARQLLENLAGVSDRFVFEMVDPDKRPELATEMEITQYGTIVVRAGDESTRITETSEEALTNALIRVTGATKKRVYFVTGHGEPDIEPADTQAGLGQLRASLENEGYEVETLLLASVPDVPADTDLLVVTAPQRPYLDQEIEVLRRHIDRGGRAIFLLEPRQGDQLVALLADYGIEVGNDVIIDQQVRLFSGPTLGVQPIVADYGFHPVTEEFSQRTVYTLSRSVKAASEVPSGITVTTLARTSPASWAESDVERLFGDNEAGLDEDDEPGPVSITVAATLSSSALDWTAPAIETAPSVDSSGEESGSETTGTEGQAATGEEGAEAGGIPAADNATPPADLEGRLVVFGDGDWVNNSNLSIYYNEDLFLNAAGWLAGEEELISIRPRSRRASRITLTQAESWAVFYSSVLLLPEIVLLAGLAIWWRRRR